MVGNGVRVTLSLFDKAQEPCQHCAYYFGLLSRMEAKCPIR